MRQPLDRLVREHLYAEMRDKAEWYLKIAKDLADGAKAHTDAGRESHVDLASIRVPTLVVWGEHDALFPARLAEAIGHRIPGAEVRVFRGVGHCPHLESPSLLAKTFDRFVTARDAYLPASNAGHAEVAARA